MAAPNTATLLPAKMFTTGEWTDRFHKVANLFQQLLH